MACRSAPALNGSACAAGNILGPSSHCPAMISSCSAITITSSFWVFITTSFLVDGSRRQLDALWRLVFGAQQRDMQRVVIPGRQHLPPRRRVHVDVTGDKKQPRIDAWAAA